MIFDEICKAIDFKVDYVIDDRNYKIEIDDIEKGLSEIADYLQKSKGKINFSELMKLYENDSDVITLWFYGQDETYISCKIYEDDYLLYDIKLKSNNSFNELMSKYCSL